MEYHDFAIAIFGIIATTVIGVYANFAGWNNAIRRQNAEWHRTLVEYGLAEWRIKDDCKVSGETEFVILHTNEIAKRYEASLRKEPEPQSDIPLETAFKDQIIEDRTIANVKAAEAAIRASLEKSATTDPRVTGQWID